MKRVRAARHYQRKDDQALALAVRSRPAIKRDIRQALVHLGTLVPPKALHFARSADWVAMKAHIDWGHARNVFKAVFARIGKTREAGAQLGARKINGSFAQARRGVRFRKAAGETHTEPDPLFGVLAKDIGDRFSFDSYDAATQTRVRREQDRLITMMEDNARGAIDVIIANAARLGAGPEDIVDYIRGLIGLNERQAQAVLNYEQNLTDQGYDEDTIAGMVSDYVDRSLDYRAAMIAQTESTRAANAGLHDAYSQAVDRGAFPSEAVTRFWQLGDSPCEICESIPDNEEDGVGVDDTFTSIDGEVDDPPVHPNCECSVEYVTNLDLVPE